MKIARGFQKEQNKKIPGTKSNAVPIWMTSEPSLSFWVFRFLVLFLDGYTWDGSCLKEMTDAAWIIFKTLELARAKNWYSNEPNVQWSIFL